jgi:predicted transposase YbfD/YdcC
VRQEGNKPAETMTSSAELSAQELLEKSRAHWSIEVQMHWQLDVGMNEDSCRIQREQAGENLAVFRHIALNLLTEEKTFKAGIKRKQKKANRSNAYLSQVLTGQGRS